MRESKEEELLGSTIMFMRKVGGGVLEGESQVADQSDPRSGCCPRPRCGSWRKNIFREWGERDASSAWTRLIFRWLLKSQGAFKMHLGSRSVDLWETVPKELIQRETTFLWWGT